MQSLSHMQNLTSSLSADRPVGSPTNSVSQFSAAKNSGFQNSASKSSGGNSSESKSSGLRDYGQKNSGLINYGKNSELLDYHSKTSEKQNLGVQTSKRSGSGNPKSRKGLAEYFVTAAITATFLAIVISLFIYFRPFTLEDVQNTANHVISCVSQEATELWERQKELRREWQRKRLAAKEAREAQKALDITQENSTPLSAMSGQEETVPYIDRTSDLGEIARLHAEPVFLPQEDAVFSFMMDTALGPMLYYSQGDIRWKDYLYGGLDPISRYGCGPVCVAMVINSFGSTGVTPVEMADWSAANHGYAKHGGSYHSLIPDSLSAFGLRVESVTDRSVENATALLSSGHLLIALMGRGSLTQNGHFIVITQLYDNGNVAIADPANYENCTKEWNLQQLMDELKNVYDSGGPLWAVSIP